MIKTKWKSKINYNKVITLGLTGALTNIMGVGLGKSLINGFIKFHNRLFVTFQWEFKSKIANQCAYDSKIKISKAVIAAAQSTFMGESNSIIKIYNYSKRYGIKAALNYSKGL